MRTASSDTYSAVTPASRRFTSSMKAGGNDHSRPTIRPTLNVMTSLSGSRVAADVAADHLPPPGPVVRPAVPDPQGMRNMPGAQQPGQILVVRPRAVVAPDGQDDVQPAERLEARGIVLVHQKVAGIVEVHGVVRVAPRHLLDVVEAAQGDHAPHLARMAQREVQRVIRAEARTP